LAADVDAPQRIDNDRIGVCNPPARQVIAAVVEDNWIGRRPVTFARSAPATSASSLSEPT
jgi:hypothetical protein